MRRHGSQFTRRAAIQKLGALFASAGVFPTELVAAASDEALNVATFHSFIDVLLPADAISASGSAAGVSDDLLLLAEGSELYSKLITFGCTWLDSTGGDGFAALSPDDQITVVQWMSTSDWNQIPRRFYYLTRQAAMDLYFSGENATAGLRLNEAPQPNGYMPPWR